MLSLDENADLLSDFGLTRNQAKVYLAMAKLGMATVSQVSKMSKVRREDVYRIMPKLEKMGLIEKILGKPTRIRAVPVEDALSLLIRREQDFTNTRLSQLATKKDMFLKKFKAYAMKPIEKEGPHFALISQREGIINKGLTMIKNAEREIDFITSREKFRQKFLTNFDEVLKEAIRKGRKVRIVIYITEHEDSIPSIVEMYRSSGAPFDLKYTDQPSGHYMIVDYKEALIATSVGSTIGKNPYLWTDDGHLIGLLQTNFEGLWHTSVNLETVEAGTIAEKLTYFLEDLRPTNHVIFLYESKEAKYRVLFNYLKLGLENGEAAVYVASEENPSQIREAMKRFGIKVEQHEKTGALQIFGYGDVYVIDGKFSVINTINLWNKLYNEALAKGFKQFRVTGEMACFFENNLIEELVEYERALHRVLEIPIIAICAYNANMVIKTRYQMNLYNELLKAHGTALFAGVDNKLGRIEIREA